MLGCDLQCDKDKKNYFIFQLTSRDDSFCMLQKYIC